MTLATALLAEWLVLLTVPLVTTFQYAFWLTVALTGARLANALSSAEHHHAFQVGRARTVARLNSIQ